VKMSQKRTEAAIFVAKKYLSCVAKDRSHKYFRLFYGLPKDEKLREFFLYIRVIETLKITGAIDPVEFTKFFFPDGLNSVD